MADFTGFYLDGIHSSTYGILRVSDGDRYTEGLIPEFEDFSIELTGGNGDLYGGRRFKPTKFTINIAFDHMTEKQFRGLRQWLGGEKLKEFRFDERPYKAYYVKVAEKPELDYICFMEDVDNNFIEKERIYKGEGEIEFIAYDPFGYCIDYSKELSIEKLNTKGSGKNWQILNSYTPFPIRDNNLVEWAEVSGLKKELEGYNDFSKTVNGQQYIATLYNPGDFDTDFQLFISGVGLNVAGTGETLVAIQLVKNKEELTNPDSDSEQYFLQFKLPKDFDFSLDNFFLNTKNHTLQWGIGGIISKDGYKYDNVSNRYDLITGGNWFKIPQGISYMKVTFNKKTTAGHGIKYNYKYY